MRYVAGVGQTRAADESAAARVGEAALIERAAFGVATVAAGVLGRPYGRRVVVLAGRGHNGADAMLAGRHLAARGAQVTVLRASDEVGDEHWIAAARGLPWRPAAAAGELLGVDLVVDGLTGVGGRPGGLTGPAADLAGWARACGGSVVAVDLPSGVDADTGACDGVTVRADVTVTFDRYKPAHVVGAGAERCGQVVVVPVGLDFPATLPLGVLDADDVAGLLPVPGASSDKYSRGVVGVLAGGDQYPGAAVLAVGGAVRAGAGYVRYLGPDLGGPADAVRARWPSVVAGDGRVDALVCGPGLADVTAVRGLLELDVPAVVDAGALEIGADALRGRRAPTLITPHAGEFARLTGTDPAADPLGVARDAARDLGVHVLLKGQRTIVAAPDGRALVNPTGSTWLSTAGTGDVLAGACGALIAAAAKRGELDLLVAAAAAAFLHGLAAHFAPVPLNAADLLDAWPQAVAAVQS
jgi:hydroxyethylthiazole kinase-like uncharacterized protein yjeF